MSTRALTQRSWNGGNGKPARTILNTVRVSGKVRTDEELIRTSNKWRDGYNPLRGLILSRMVSLLESGQRGEYAELQWVYHICERRFPILKALVARRLGAIGRLDFGVKVVEKVPNGMDNLAEEQKAFLTEVYDKIGNVREAIKELARAEFRGYSILQKHFDKAGEIIELHYLPQWTWIRDGMYGGWFYNPTAQPFSAMSLAKEVMIGEGLPRNEFIIRECPAPINEIGSIAYVNSVMGRKDWSGIVELFGLRGCIITMPPDVPAGQEEDYKNDAMKVAASGTGAIPNGASVSFPTTELSKQMPFKEFLDYQKQDVVEAGTGGKLTMLAQSTGIGKGPAEEQADVFDDIAATEAMDISEVFQTDLDAVALEAKFPGKPVLAYFELRPKDEADATVEIDNAIKLKSAWNVTAEEVSERSGWDVTDKVIPSGLAGPGGAAIVPGQGVAGEDSGGQDGASGGLPGKPGAASGAGVDEGKLAPAGDEDLINKQLSEEFFDKALENVGALPGHEFRGNQFTDVAGQGGEDKGGQGDNKSATSGTESKAFKEWFAGSKVVDEDGEPLVVYHGGKAVESFDVRAGEKTYRHESSALGSFFSTDKETAAQYGDVHEVMLSITNPLDISERDLSELDTIPKARLFRMQAKRDGFDGIRVTTKDSPGFKGGTEWVAFESAQIKSKFNKGTWSKSDANISNTIENDLSQPTAQPVNPTPLTISSPPLPEDHALLKAAADDLAPIRTRLEAILSIEDEDIKKIKLVRFRDELPKLLHDMNADPEMGRAMEKELVNAFFNGLTGANKGANDAKG